MDLSSLKPASGSIKKCKRIGRGEGSGRGGTSTRGHKGAKSRSGYSQKIGFEGGQMPLARRMPKFGFTSRNKIVYRALNLNEIEALSEQLGKEELTVNDMVLAGLVKKNDKVKLLANGKLTKKINVKVHAFSKSAQRAVEALNGIVEKI